MSNIFFQVYLRHNQENVAGSNNLGKCIEAMKKHPNFKTACWTPPRPPIETDLSPARLQASTSHVKLCTFDFVLIISIQV